ncbi:P-loop domain protein, KAP family [Flavobacterium beibuense]|uniref:P-loop domain protein, KAP family n=1 Tax=Flavobacterium beibuense TaxID=657326 RepID=A0A444WEI1_9FLAO|nr:P-loop domain protein, KAP family [Flavobacterium beibuense]
MEANATGQGFVEDNAIELPEHDSFNRKELAKGIAELITLTKNKKSFAIGILGAYGSGKTSFINLIKQYFDKAGVEIIDFNAWSPDGAQNIQRDFFDLLASRLNKIDSRLSTMVLDYSRKLARTDSGFEKVIRQLGFAGRLFGSETYTDDYERINAALKVSGKKIVIIIDDLDRLYPEEILEILRLIRNTADFANIFYLVAYDRDFVNEAVSSLNANVKHSFLDKIMQMEIPLPKRDHDALLILLEDHLGKFINEEHLEAYRNHILPSGFGGKHEFSFEEVFRQSRDVIRFANSFTITYSKLSEEVNFENLFVLELIKFRFPQVYDRLYESREDFIHTPGSRALHAQVYELKKYGEGRESKFEAERILRAEGYYSEPDIDLIVRLLQNLFFKFDRIVESKNAILYPMCFDRYFRYRLSASELSERQFKEAFAGGLPTMQALIDRYQQDDLLRKVQARLLQIKAKTKQEFELQIESLFYVGSHYIVSDNRRTFDYQALVRLLWNHEHAIDKMYYRKETNGLGSFLTRLFTEAVHPYIFYHSLIYYIKEDKTEVGIEKETLLAYQISYFKSHVEKEGLSEEAIYMFFGTKRDEFIPLPDDSKRGHMKTVIEKDMAVAIREVLPAYDPFYFLKHSIKYDMRNGNIYTISPQILEIFSSPAELRKVAETNSFIDETVRTEYLAFFDLSQANGFDKWTEYEFTTDLKPN